MTTGEHRTKIGLGAKSCWVIRLRAAWPAEAHGRCADLGPPPRAAQPVYRPLRERGGRHTIDGSAPALQQPRASRLDATPRQPDRPPGDSCWSRRSARARSNFGSAGMPACSIDFSSSGGAQDGAFTVFTLLRLLAVMRTSSTTWAARSGTCSRSASHRAFGCAEHGAFSAVETTSGLWKLNVGFSPSGLGMGKYSVR